jgi:hypothetical protein
MTAETNADGIAYIDGLSNAAYFVDVYAHGYAVESSEPKGAIDTSETSLVSIQLEPILAAVPHVVGDEIMTYRVATKRLGPRSTLESRYLHAARVRLQEQFPASLDVVVLLARDLNPDPLRDPSGHFQPQARLSVLGSGTGLHEIDLIPAPVLEIVRPQVIDLSKTMPRTRTLEELVVRIQDATGDDVSEYLGGVFSVVLGELRIPLKAGANILPPGTYNVECSKSRLAEFEPLSVAVPGVADIKLNVAVQPVRIRVVDRDAVEYYRYSYTLSSGGQSSIQVVFDSTDKKAVLPCGDAALTVSVGGFKTFNGTFAIERQPLVQVLECLVEIP